MNSTSDVPTLLLILLAGALPAGVLACHDDPAGPSPGPGALTEAAGWELVRLVNPDGAVAIREGPRGAPSLAFGVEPVDGGMRVAGDGGCNLGGGAYTAERGGALEFRDLAWTEMLCLSSPLMESEEAFLDALPTVHAYRFANGRLVLEFPGGHMEFAPGKSFGPESDGSPAGSRATGIYAL